VFLLHLLEKVPDDRAFPKCSARFSHSLRITSSIPARAASCIGLINEQDSVERAADDLLRLEGGMPDVSGHQPRPVDFDQMPFRKHPERSIGAGGRRGISAVQLAFVAFIGLGNPLPNTRRDAAVGVVAIRCPATEHAGSCPRWF